MLDFLEVTAVLQDEAAAAERARGEGVGTTQGPQRVTYGRVELGAGQYGRLAHLPHGRVGVLFGRPLGSGQDGVAGTREA